MKYPGIGRERARLQPLATLTTVRSGILLTEFDRQKGEQHNLILSWAEFESLLRRTIEAKPIHWKFRPDRKDLGTIVSDSLVSLELVEGSTASNFYAGYGWTRLASFIRTHGLKMNASDARSAAKPLLENATVGGYLIICTAMQPGISILVHERSTERVRYLPLDWMALGGLARRDGKAYALPLDYGFKGNSVLVNCYAAGILVTLYDEPTRKRYTLPLAWGHLKVMASKEAPEMEGDDFRRKSQNIYNLIMQDPERQ